MTMFNLDCSHFKITMHCVAVFIQAVAFLPKTVCNIKEVEFARAVKLNKTSIELIMFQVPRVKASILSYWLALCAGKINQILWCDWLLEGSRGHILPIEDCMLSPAKNSVLYLMIPI